VQQIELWLIVAGILLLLAAGVTRYRALIARRPLAFAAALGIVPVVLGALGSVTQAM
jgi:hypothetical protein